MLIFLDLQSSVVVSWISEIKEHRNEVKGVVNHKINSQTAIYPPWVMLDTLWGIIVSLQFKEWASCG